MGIFNSSMDRAEARLESWHAEADQRLAQSEYELVLEAALVQEGMSSFQAMGAVAMLRESDKQQFRQDAVNHESHRKRMTEGEFSISHDVYNHSVMANPAMVVATAVAWAEVR